MADIKEIIQQSKTVIGKPWTFQDNEGSFKICRYQVFDGIELLFLEVHREKMGFHSKPSENVFAINHCQEGRIECQFNSGEYLYMTAGDLALGWRVHQQYQHNAYFPTKYFKGINLIVNVEKAQVAIDEEVQRAHVNLMNIANTFCDASDFGLILEEDDGLKHIFASLYEVPEAIAESFYRIKVLEIFLRLSVINQSQVPKKMGFRKQQVEIVKAIHAYLDEMYYKPLTLESLGKQFNIPVSTLKRCFKGVFGVSVHQYIKQRRIDEAKRLLYESDETVLQIANTVGYENASKFTSVFKEIQGVTPSQYRKM